MSTDISIQVEFHATIQKVFGENSSRVTLSGPLTVRKLLEVVCTSPERYEKIFDDAGKLRTGVTVLRNGRNIVFLESLNTELNNGDKIALFPPVAGG